MRVFLYGYYGFGNLGDEALLWTLLRAIEQYAGKRALGVNYVIPASRVLPPLPRDVSRRVRFISLYLKDLVEASRHADLVIFGGGSQFQDYGNLRRVKYLLKHYLVVKSAKRAAGFGLSVGPLGTLIGRYVTSATLKRLNPLLVRDKKSLQFCHRNRIGAFYCMDLVFASYLNLKSARLETSVKGSADSSIALSLLPFGRMVGKDENYDIVWTDQFAIALSRVIKEFPTISVVGAPFQRGVDESVIQKVLRSVPKERTEILSFDRGPERALLDLSKSSYFIAMRFHAVVYAALLQKPVLIINYHPKVRYLAEALGYRAKAVIDLYDLLSAELVAERIGELIRSPDDFIPGVDVTNIVAQTRQCLDDFISHTLESIV